MGAIVIYGQESRLLPWACERIGVASFRRDAYTIGLERDGELVAVVVFEDFSECDASIHIASDGTGRWMNKELLIKTFAYPFIQLGLRRLTGRVPAKNKVALRFDENLGFVQEGICKHALKDDDLVILGLLKENCRFIPKGVSHG